MAVPDTRSRPGNRHGSGRTWLRSRPTRTYLGITALTVVSIGLVLLSPLALELLNRTRGVDWMQLSNIGQTYGAISAVLTVFAVGGVALSLVLQVREVRTARNHAGRTFHHSLLEQAMNDPLYLNCWGTFPSASSSERRQSHYVNLVISYWQMLYEIGELDEQAVRHYVAEDLFPSEAARRYWSAVRHRRCDFEDHRYYPRFHNIIDEEYEKAVAAGPPLVPAEPVPVGQPPTKTGQFPARSSHTTTAAFLGLAGGLLLRDPLRRILHR